MQFNILKNATLPLLKLQVVKDGRSDFNKFMEMIEQSSIFFSMVNTETGIPKISSRPAGFVEKTFLDPNAEPEYYIYYQFTNRDTNTPGRYQGEFLLRNSDGVLIIPIREQLNIDILDSFIADDLEYTSCYVSEFPCCINGPYIASPTPSPTPTPTPTPNPSMDTLLTYFLYGNIFSGSVIGEYTLITDIPIDEDIELSFVNSLDLVTGGTLEITSTITILSGETTGFTRVELLNFDYNNLSLTGEFSLSQISGTNITTNVFTELNFGLTYSLGRNYIEDIRDNNYLISDLPKSVVKPTTIYWEDNEWWGNQGNTPQCVGYAWAHWIEDGPITHNGPAPIINPTTIYREAQKIDEWAGENYNGTSVRAGAKYLKNTGKISAYYWAYDINTLIDTVLTKGPVVVGTNWYYNMFYPDKSGLIKVSGYLAGGHAYVINGIDTVKKQFRIKNSWGRSWGQQGHAYISFTDMTRLIREQGEICLATENKF